jgi:hypothetical protein
MTKSEITNDYRVQYYCGKKLNQKICYNKNISKDTDFIYIDNFEDKDENEYKKDLFNIVKTNKFEKKYKGQILNYCPRDRVEIFTKVPTLVKSRLITDIENYSIVTKMNSIRHFDDLKNVKKIDIPFEQKKNVVIWRGATTGYGFGNEIPYRSVSREVLIEKYCNQKSLQNGIDVGLTKLIQGAEKNPKDYKKFIKPFMTRKQLLENKYILSVEGNDVATNLKWIMCSNSVLLMPKPQIESWIMESHLIPYVHFVPIMDDFSDLQTQLIWCNRNQKKCLKIIKNARKFIKVFLNESNEKKVMKSVLECYLKNISFC